MGTAYTDVWPDSESKLVSCITAISTPLSNVYKYLNSGSGITNCGNIQKWSIETVKNSVIKICPVLVECNGSAFIVDGYAMTKNKSLAVMHIFIVILERQVILMVIIW